MTVLTTDHADPAPASPTRAPLPFGWVEPRGVPRPRAPRADSPPVGSPPASLAGSPVERPVAEPVAPSLDPAADPAASPRRSRTDRPGRHAGRRPAGAAPVPPSGLLARPVARPLRPTAARQASWSCERVHVRRRVAALVVVFLAVTAVVVGLALLGSAAAADDVPQGTAVVQVQQGETLWEVAQRVAPEAPTSAVVDRIRELNDMRGATVHPGQPLVVPAG